MAALLDALRGRARQRDANAVDVIADSAKAAASQKTYDVAAVERALHDLGMGIVEFEAAVAQARQRAIWLSQFEQLNAATTRAAKLEAAIQAEEAKLDQMRQATIAKCAKLREEWNVVEANRITGANARDELLSPANVPGSIGREYRDALVASQAADEAVGAARRAVRDQQERIASEQRWIEQLTGEAGTLKPDRVFTRGGEHTGEPPRVQEHRQALARAQRRKSEADAALADAEQAAAVARKALDALTLEVLKA